MRYPVNPLSASQMMKLGFCFTILFHRILEQLNSTWANNILIGFSDKVYVAI